MTEVSAVTATIPWRGGTIAYRELAALHPASHPTLMCLHPAPFGGDYFSPVLPLLNKERDVIAPDYPGHGDSTPLANPPTIGEFAEAMLAVPAAKPIDVMGFHTGCLVAVEMAVEAPVAIGRLVLIDIPFFVGETQQKKYAEAIPENSPPPEKWGFHAAFTYPCEKRFALLDKHVSVIATSSALREPTREAASTLKRATLIERDDIRKPVFGAHASGIAEEILANLTR